MTNVPGVRYALTFGALKMILEEEEPEIIVLQILGYKQIPGNSNRFRLLLNDGVVLFPYAVLATQLNNLIYNKSLEKYTIFRLKDYAYSDLITNKKVVICLDIEILVPGSEVNEKISKQNVSSLGNSSVAKLNTPIHLSPVLFNSELYPLNTTENTSLAPREHTSLDTDSYISNSDVVHNWDTAQSNMNISIRSAEGVQFSSICSLSPYRNKWTIKARVSYKSPIISYSNLQREGQYFSFHLLDESGEIRATAFNEDAKKIYELLENFKIYIISNASVKPAPENAPIRNDFEITIDGNTKIEPCMIEESSIPMPMFNFKTIRQITLLSKDTLTDVIGVCDQVSDISTILTKSNNKEISKRNISLIDESKVSVTVTLWGATAENFPEIGNHVVAIKNARVTYFRGLSLNVSLTSLMYIDPKIDKASKLRSWFQSFDPSVPHLLSISNTQETASENWKTLAEVFAYDKINIPLYHNTKATIIRVRKEKCIYKACPSAGCLKKVNELENELYHCNKCDTSFNTFDWVLLLSLQVADFTGSHWITVFKEMAECLIGLTSEEFSRIKNEDQVKCDEILDKLNLKSFIFKMRSSYEIYNDDTHLKSSVLSVSTIECFECIPYTRKLLTDVKKMTRILNNS